MLTTKQNKFKKMRSWFLIISTLFIATPPTFAQIQQPLFGSHYQNIKWSSHLPNPTDEGEVERGQIDIGRVDLNGDKKGAFIKVIWSTGVSNKLLTIELYKDKALHELISKIKPITDMQPNFKLEDLDGDGKLAVIVWSALWDPRLSGEEGVTKSTFEGHSSPHKYVVATYKLVRNEYLLWNVYTTVKRYEPFFTWEQKGLPE